MSGIYIILALSFFFLILITFIVLILVIPTKLSFLMATEGSSMRTELNFNVLYGLLKGSMISHDEDSSFKLLFASLPIYSKAQRKGEPQKETKSPKRRPKRMSPQESISLFKNLYGPFERLLRAVIRHTHVKELDCRINVGLPDPVQTGMVCGISIPLWETLHPHIPNASFALSPVFTEELLDASLRGRISLRILLILVPLLRLFTKKEFRMIMKR